MLHIVLATSRAIIWFFYFLNKCSFHFCAEIVLSLTNIIPLYLLNMIILINIHAALICTASNSNILVNWKCFWQFFSLRVIFICFFLFMLNCLFIYLFTSLCLVHKTLGNLSYSLKRVDSGSGQLNCDWSTPTCECLHIHTYIHLFPLFLEIICQFWGRGLFFL